MRCFYKPKCKEWQVTKRLFFSQNSWLLLLPSVCLYGTSDYERFTKLCAISVEWLYWGMTIQIMELD